MLSNALRQSRKLLPSKSVRDPLKLQFNNISTTSINLKRFGPSNFVDNETPKRVNFKDNLLKDGWLRLIEKYPDFLPDPMNNSPLLVHRLIDDMLARRNVIDIPEFYVGSILSVTVSDNYADNKRTKFVGICIARMGQLKKANFTLRNVIDGMGCEIRYDLYNPLILSIEVLKLEKRLDDSLLYLRDALPEYSTVPEDLKAEVVDDESEVPLNKLLVRMKPKPWSQHWERYLYKGIEKFENVPQFFAKTILNNMNNPIYSFDTMMEYRRHCTEELMYSICKRLSDHEKDVVEVRKAAKSKRFLRINKSVTDTP